MKALAIREVTSDSDEIDMRTKRARWADPRISDSFSATQAFTWEDGDAIVVVTGGKGKGETIQTYVVARAGDRIEIIRANGITKALKLLCGIDTLIIAVA